MVKNDSNVRSVIIIGGGVAGLSAAIYLSRAGLAPLVFAGSPPGGQLMLTSEVENFPGQKSILGEKLIDIMRQQAISFGATIVDENVKSVETSLNQLKSVVSASGEIHRSKAIVVATGAKALWMGLPSETRLRGKGVSACATCDGFFFKNKIVAVIGGGDSALEEALTLTKFASKVYIVHRRGEFKASQIMQKRIFEQKKIEILWNAQVEEIIGTQRVEGLKLKSVEISLNQLKPVQSNKTDFNRSQLILTVKVDGVFVAIGHRPDTDLVKGQIELDERGYVLTTAMYAIKQLKSVKISQSVKISLDQLKSDETSFNCEFPTMTSVEGIFGAGDCVDYVYKQASTAAGMGVQAALDAERWLG